MDSLNVEVNLWWQQSSQDIGIEFLKFSFVAGEHQWKKRYVGV